MKDKGKKIEVQTLLCFLFLNRKQDVLKNASFAIIFTYFLILQTCRIVKNKKHQALKVIFKTFKSINNSFKIF